MIKILAINRHFWTYLPCPCNLAPSGDHNGEGGENVVRPEELAFLRQDQIKLLRQRIQELKATLRDQQQESCMWQKRLDLVLNQVLSNECIEDKDDAGKGLHWVPSPRCTLCHRIRTCLQEPMPEHVPPPVQKLPAPLSRRRRLLFKKNVRSPVHRHCSSCHAFRSTHALPHRRSWGRRRGGHPGTKHGDARSHHRRTVPSRAVRSLPAHSLVHQKATSARCKTWLNATDPIDK